MSTTELDDSRRLSVSKTILYHVNPLQVHKTQEDSLYHHQTGPDVTLATNAVSSLNILPTNLGQEQESPDLVSIGSEPPIGATSTTYWSSAQNHPNLPKMSHSYCQGPSHMYL